MRGFNKFMMALLVIIMIGGLMISVSSAQERVKKIIIFREDLSWEEIDQYVHQWRPFGLSSRMRLPLVHGLVVLVPSNISSTDLANDPRVVSVENDQRIRVRGQAVSATADGGAADGGAADGGAADGGAADGGAADGGAYAGPLQLPPFWSFIHPVTTPPVGHRPWGILKLFGQLRNPSSLTDVFDPDDVPDVIELALRKMRRQRIRVAIFDTGIDFSHPSLDRAVKRGIDLVSMTQGRLPRDDNGHGTHVAGTLCARLRNHPFGMEPDVHIYAVKILDQYASGELSNIIMGLQWAIDRDIDVVNMSIGYRDRSPAVGRAIHSAYQAGLIMVAAAGNHSNWDDPPIVAAADGGAADGGAADGGAADGGAADGGAADGGAADGGAADGGAADGGAADGGAADGGAADGGAADGGAAGWYSIMYPARYSEVIAVGASTSSGMLASFSNSGPQLDIIAPGTDVVSTNMGGGFGIASGTSMASPHVTGAIAMMLAINPHLDVAEIKRILKETAHGAGELNLIGALEKILEMSEDEDRFVVFDRQMRTLFKRIYREELKKKLRAAGVVY